MTTKLVPKQAPKHLTQGGSVSILRVGVCNYAYSPQAVQAALDGLYSGEIDSDARADVQVALQRIPRKYAIHLLLRAQGYTFDEIAEKMGVHRITTLTYHPKAVLALLHVMNGGEGVTQEPVDLTGYLTVQAAADLLGVTPNALHIHISRHKVPVKRDGRIPMVRLEDLGSLKVTLSTFLPYLLAQRGEGL